MQPSVWVFDLDGTLLNTAELNRQAYETVGVKIPADAAGLSWREWLPDYCGGSYEMAATLHQQKSLIYLSQLIKTDLAGMHLPALRVVQELFRDNPTRVKILTAAALLTTRRLMNRFSLDTIEYHAELTYDTRMNKLRSWSMFADVTYIDDNIDTVKKLAVDAPDVRVVHYTGQDLDTVKQEMGVPTWTR